MVQSRFDRLRQQKAERDGHKITLQMVTDATGIASSTLHKLSTGNWTGIYRNTIDALCKYFGVGVGDLLEYVPEAEEAE